MQEKLMQCVMVLTRLHRNWMRMLQGASGNIAAYGKLTGTYTK